MTKLNISCTKETWILSRMAEAIFKYKPDDFEINFCVPNPDQKNVINYYVAYHQFKRKTLGIDVSFLTHPENDNFLNSAKKSNHCIVMCEKYKKFLIEENIPENKITLIYPGVEDNYKPKIKILQPGKIQSEKRMFRKGYELWNKVKQIPYVECICTEGNYTAEQLLDLYNSCDVILSTANLEGGPMCVIEGLALGKKVVAPKDVGFINDFSGIVTYKKENFEELKNILDEIYKRKLRISKNVEHLTWKNWAENHFRVFRNLDKRNK